MEFFPAPVVAPNESVGRAVMPQRGHLGAFQLRSDPRRQRFAEFHTPLIERINLPYHSLCKDTVFVKGDKLAKGLRSEALNKNGV